MVVEAIEKAGHLDKCTVGLDVASSEFKVPDKNEYDLDFKSAARRAEKKGSIRPGVARSVPGPRPHSPRTAGRGRQGRLPAPRGGGARAERVKGDFEGPTERRSAL